MSRRIINKSKKKNDYLMPESIPLGEILIDVKKTQWKVGHSIGKGGFGEIYTVCRMEQPSKNIEDYEYVVKIEPHGNGPLFVEMHFYMRNAKEEDIKLYLKQKNIKKIGMPYLIGSGSQNINGIKHRFIIMPRFGKDIWYYFLQNGRKLPEHTSYRIALQMLDVYEYIHNCTYVHNDLKGSNILLGFGKLGLQQAFLVDFGLASRYQLNDFKPDPKKMHNGTIEYTSRDAHLGVPTMRGDIEILGYNLIHWSGTSLPWETKRLLNNPDYVQKAKETFMENIQINLDELYNKKIPAPIKDLFYYIKTLKFNHKPDYDMCRNIFLKGLKTLRKVNVGDLELEITKSQTTDINNFSIKEDIFNKGVPNPSISLPNRSSSEISIKRNVIKRKTSPLKTSAQKRQNQKPNYLRSSVSSFTTFSANSSETTSCSGSVMNSNTKKGKTVINDNLTPKPQSKKTYEFNFELDVSMDANVIINVKRKKNPKCNGNKDKQSPQLNIFEVKSSDCDGTNLSKRNVRRLN